MNRIRIEEMKGYATGYKMARVTVYGAGVTGLTAAHELTTRGFKVRVVERARGFDETGKAGMVIGGLARTQYAPVKRPVFVEWWLDKIEDHPLQGMEANSDVDEVAGEVDNQYRWQIWYKEKWPDAVDNCVFSRIALALASDLSSSLHVAVPPLSAVAESDARPSAALELIEAPFAKLLEMVFQKLGKLRAMQLGRAPWNVRVAEIQTVESARRPIALVVSGKGLSEHRFESDENGEITGASLGEVAKLARHEGRSLRLEVMPATDAQDRLRILELCRSVGAALNKKTVQLDEKAPHDPHCAHEWRVVERSVDVEPRLVDGRPRGGYTLAVTVEPVPRSPETPLWKISIPEDGVAREMAWAVARRQYCRLCLKATEYPEERSRELAAMVTKELEALEKVLDGAVDWRFLGVHTVVASRTELGAHWGHVSIAHVVLPGEHGFRFFPPFYRHIFDTMSRTPIYDGEGRITERTVLENVRPAPMVAVAAGKESRPFIMPQAPNEQLVDWLYRFQNIAKLRYSPTDIWQLMLRILRFMSSCPERRAKEGSAVSWFDYLRGMDAETRRCRYAYSKQFAEDTKFSARALLAFDAQYGDAHTNGNIYLQLFMAYMRTLDKVDGTLNAPTTESWLNPWRMHLGAHRSRLHPRGARPPGDG